MDQFHDALVQSPDDEALWSACADWHEERGDPRAELMRTFSDALLAKHWATWFPNIAPNSLELTWRHGFVHTARLRRAHDVDALLALPSMKWLRSLTLDCASSLSSLGGLPLLSALTLNDVSRLDVARLATLPPLRELTVPSKALPHLVARVDALHVLVEEALHEPELARLEGKYPHARFTPQLHEETNDFRWTFGPRASLVPQLAPKNVLDLPPWTEKRKRGTQSDEHSVHGVGSGAASLNSGRGWLNRCMHCASSVVMFVFHESWSLYSHFETTSYERREFRCLKCKHFTAYHSVHER